MIVVVMGVAGSGKSRIGRQLAVDLGWLFIDADDLHPPGNVARMSRGVPLTDADRAPWLARIRLELLEAEAGGKSVVLACSALRQRFREELAAGLHDVRFAYLRGTADLFAPRLSARSGHFFRATLLQSQFDALEEPSNALIIDAARDPEAIVREIQEGLRLTGG